MRSEIENLIRVLAFSIGNKRYLADLEAMLLRAAAGASPAEKESLRYLASDIRSLDAELNRARKQPWLPFR